MKRVIQEMKSRFNADSYSENEENHNDPETTKDDDEKQRSVQELKRKFLNLSRSHTISTSTMTPPEVSSAPHNECRRTQSMLPNNKPITAPGSRHSLAGPGPSTSRLKPSTPPETTATPGSNSVNGLDGQSMSEEREGKFSWTNLSRRNAISKPPVTPPDVSSSSHNGWRPIPEIKPRNHPYKSQRGEESTESPAPPTPLKTDIYPSTWNRLALPEIGCKKVPVSDASSEFSEIVGSFTNTVSGHVVKKLWRLQNPSLWKKFHGQKEQMKKINQGQEVKEMRLFHGTKDMDIDAICNENFDCRLCGTNGTDYGQGSYFSQGAFYSHFYSSEAPDGTQSMFVARVLVGDYVEGNPQMKRPPLRPGSTTRYYDSCVDDISDPTVFVVFEKHQIYPEYLLEYGVDESLLNG